MTFSSPLWLGVAVVVMALGVAGLRIAEARRRRDLERFVAGPLLAALTATSSTRRRLGKGGLLLAGLALGCIALARPTLGWDWQETHHRGTDVLFAVDVSRSMLAEDVKPDRLTRAKLAVIDLLQKLKGDRVGLVAFAGSAFLQSPLTADQGAFQQTLEALDTDVIPRGGTDVGAALHEAEEAFRTAGDGPKLLVLVTDGEDLAGNAKVAAEEAAKQGIRVYTVGVGTPAGDRISLARAGERGLVVDERGQPVVSKLDEENLRAVAEATGGFYVPLGAHGEGLDAIYERVLADAPKQDLATRSQRTPIERYQWPLGLALALFVGEALLGERRRSRVAAAPARALRALRVAAPAIAALVLAGSASASPRDAEAAYAAGSYDAALGQYRAAADAAPDDARLRFNEGAAAYRAGKHDEAAQAFTRALDSHDVPLQQRAYYDLGNARFRLGEAAAKTSPDEARKALEESIKAYDGALALDAKDENARFNRDVAKARLEQLKQQQQQQNEQQKQSNESQQQQNEKQQSDAQQKGQQGQQDQQQQNAEQGQDSQQQQQQGAKQDQASKGQPQPGGRAQDAKAPQPGDSSGQPSGQEAKNDAAQKPSKDAGQEPEAGTPDAAGAGSQSAKNEPGPRRDEAEGQGAGAAKKDGTPERADGKSAGAEPGSNAHEGRPGEMNAEDAARLLDSLKGDEKQAPRAAFAHGGAGRNDDEPTRNW